MADCNDHLHRLSKLLGSLKEVKPDPELACLGRLPDQPPLGALVNFLISAGLTRDESAIEALCDELEAAHVEAVKARVAMVRSALVAIVAELSTRLPDGEVCPADVPAAALFRYKPSGSMMPTHAALWCDQLPADDPLLAAVPKRVNVGGKPAIVLGRLGLASAFAASYPLAEVSKYTRS